MEGERQQAFVAAALAQRLEVALALVRSSAEVDESEVRAHPWLRALATEVSGPTPNPVLADALTPRRVRLWRDLILHDDVPGAQTQLIREPELVHADFVAGRGIAQALHHVSSIRLGEVLISAGADVNALNSVHGEGETPLYQYVRAGWVEGADWLLEQGADPNRGRMFVMPSASMEELVRLLVRHRWDVNRGPLWHDANHGHGKKVRIMLAAGADPNHRGRDGLTPLHVVARRGTDAQLLADLVIAGADMNALDDQGRTPLDWAEHAQASQAAKQLKMLGARHGG